MKNINELYNIENRKIKVLQFGEGNFLRCFVDWIIHKMNKEESLDFSSNVCIVQPLDFGMIDRLQAQNGLYTVILEGLLDKKEYVSYDVVDNLADFINPYAEYDRYLEYAKSEDLEYIISNTTEAGIVLNKDDVDFSKTPASFPGKLLALLKTRYDHFNGDKSKGLDIIPCELIDYNGDNLKKILIELAHIANLDEEFIDWVANSNRYYNTLVDRIVPGYPRNQANELWEKFGYVDNMMVKGEPFLLWVIEDHHNLSAKFPANKIVDVKFVDDVTLYKVRKVKILNGAHTLMVPVSYLKGNNTVEETMHDEYISAFVKKFVYDEVIPTIDLPYEDMANFAESVFERYENPFVRHELMSISLNSMTKYKTRILSSVIDNLNNNKFPVNALYSLAALMVFYKGERNGEPIKLSDDQVFLDLYKELWAKYDGSKESVSFVVKGILGLKEHFEYDLLANNQVVEFVCEATYQIVTNGIVNDFFKEKCNL